MTDRMVPRRRGFWMGALVGFAITAAIATLLALAFPPIPAPPPDLPPEAAAAPAAPEASRALVRTGTPGALIPDRPGAEMPPALPGLAPPVAPDVFEGQPSGSPSLVPPAGE